MSQESRLKRLQYRSCHRGCKETDIILGHFANSAIAHLEPAALDIYERLLDEDDADIWDWIIAKTSPPEEYTGLLAMMKKLKVTG